MNTKVQRCWVTPSQPSEAYVDGDEDEGEEEDEKAKVTVGNKWELTNNQQSTINTLARGHVRTLCLFPHRHPQCSRLHQDCRVDLVSPSVELWCSTYIVTDFGVSNFFL